MSYLDRYGEPIEPTATDDEIHAARCTDGFLGEDAQGRPIVCLRCRPHLAKPNHRKVSR